MPSCGIDRTYHEDPPCQAFASAISPPISSKTRASVLYTFTLGSTIVGSCSSRTRPFKTLVAAYHSDEVREFILIRFDGAILPVF
jgi:hypothetical protein